MKSPIGGSAPPRVAILVPLSDREELMPEEEISYRHLTHYLGRYEKYILVPEGARMRFPGFEVKEFNGRYFGSAAAHNRLMLSRHFYESFEQYDYVMIYHLDSLAFADRLEEWCGRGFDYIGAPWIPCDETPWVRQPYVGNGGFSLRRVRAMLRVLDSTRLTETPEEYWRKLQDGRSSLSLAVHYPRRFLKRLRRFNGVQRHAAQWNGNEDLFWGGYAVHYDPEFRMAPVESALEFAFEAAPRICMEMNGRRLPFGCHAWFRYDRAFWEPYLIQERKGTA